MYNDYFGFREPPFSIAPDPRYLYMTAQHREALAHLVYGLNSDGGCILLTGEVGTGKTTICRCLLEQIPEQAHVALVLNPKLSEIELLETICDELKIDYPDAGNTVKTYTDRIYDFLIESHRRNEKTVLIIDEAQNLSSEVLEQLRLLTNLETDQRKLLQIIILGQPELLQILAQPQLRQLAQRITARFHLQPLSREELRAYINHRLAVAGQNIQLFPDDSLRLLYRLSKGVPRLINILCDRALLGAYVENQPVATPTIVKKAAAEVFGELKNVEQQQNRKPWLWPALLLSAVVPGIVVIWLLGDFQAFADRSADDIPEKASISAGVAETTADEQNTAAEPETGQADTAGHGEQADEQGHQQALTNSVPVTVADAPPATETGSSDIVDEPAAEQIADLAAEKAKEQAEAFRQALQQSGNSQISAYRQLFEQWGLRYNSRSSRGMCRQAADAGLSCLHKQGNLNSLLSHNRPAVLTLFNARGEKRYVTLQSVEQATADTQTLQVSLLGETYHIDARVLDRHWYGQYLLLWKKPADYTGALKPGSREPLVRWLDRHMAAIGGQQQLGSEVYDQALLARVKQFQQRQGLTADGIVGPVTLIHINSLTGNPGNQALPRLRPQAVQQKAD